MTNKYDVQNWTRSSKWWRNTVKKMRQLKLCSIFTSSVNRWVPTTLRGGTCGPERLFDVKIALAEAHIMATWTQVSYKQRCGVSFSWGPYTRCTSSKCHGYFERGDEINEPSVTLRGALGRREPTKESGFLGRAQRFGVSGLMHCS